MVDKRRGRRTGDDDVQDLRERMLKMESIWDERAGTAAELRDVILDEQKEARVDRRTLRSELSDLRTGQAVLQVKAVLFSSISTALVFAILQYAISR